MYILETDAKRFRAEKKRTEEERKVKAVLVDIDEKRRLLKKKNAVVEELKQNLRKLRICLVAYTLCLEQDLQHQRFLEGVLMHSDQFTETDEVHCLSSFHAELAQLLTRYKVLASTHADLKSEAAAVQERCEKMQAALLELQKSKQNVRA